MRINVSACMLLAALLFGAMPRVSAQHAEAGLRLMPAFAAFRLNSASGEAVSGVADLGFGVGAFIAYHFTEYVGVQGEIIYSGVSQRYTELDVERRVKLKYMNIPVLISLNTGISRLINVQVVAGPQLGLRTGSRLQVIGDLEPGTPEAVLSVKQGDLSFAYGIGFDAGVNRIRTLRAGVGFRGSYGLFDIAESSRSLPAGSYYILDRSHIRTSSVYAGMSFQF